MDMPYVDLAIPERTVQNLSGFATNAIDRCDQIAMLRISHCISSDGVVIFDDGNSDNHGPLLLPWGSSALRPSF
jgi:hypothetical protein